MSIKETLSNVAVSFTETAVRGMGVGLIAYGGAECVTGSLLIASGGIKNVLLGAFTFVSGLYTAGVGVDAIRCELSDDEDIRDRKLIRLEFKSE